MIEADQYQRLSDPSISNNGYGSRWQKESKMFLQHHPLCIECRKKICNVEITNEPAYKPEEFDIRRYINKDIKIYETETKEVILECANEQIQNVIDYFGDQIEPYPAGEERFYVAVRAEDSLTFYAWVFKAAGDIRIIEPKGMLKKYRRLLRKGLKN